MEHSSGVESHELNSGKDGDSKLTANLSLLKGPSGAKYRQPMANSTGGYIEVKFYKRKLLSDCGNWKEGS